jgi:hypothetical protein
MVVELDQKVFGMEDKLNKVEINLHSHILNYNLKLKA